MNHWRTKYPSKNNPLNFEIIFVANEGARSVIQGAQFKRMGRLKGHSDLYMFWAVNNVGYVAWLEMKKPTGKLRNDQDEFLDSIPNTTNFYKGAAYSFNEGKELISSWIKLSGAS